jgi:hypothetical protein
MEFLPLLEKVDSNLRSCLEYLLNIRLNEIQWLQASLPISRDCFGNRKIAFPLSPYWSIRYLAVGLFFPLFFPLCAGAPGYFARPPTPTLSSPFSYLDNTTRNTTQTSMGGPSGLGFEPC